MCGICGTIGIPNAADAARAVGNMNAAMLHRGPDEQGELIAPAAAPYASIGMRRLSIIDLSGGHQPVFNEAGDVAIVFNGEIYDFSSLRAELERRGHVFRTHSDTETIVHAYEEWGEACLGRLRGMFGFAILDMRGAPNGQRGAAQGGAAQDSSAVGPRLLLARDRLGIKPFYYAIVDGVFVFASELRALLASGKLPRRLSQEALDSYLLFGSICEPMTLVDGVFSLPPGHFMTVPADKRVHEVHPRPYWTFGAAAQNVARQNVARNNDSSAPVTLASAAKQLRPLLEEAVSCHLIADVPLGVFLSSGLDSTALVALAGSARAGLHTFTVIFDEQDFSEAELARATARRFRTCHEEFLLTGAQMLAGIDDAVAALDQPSMDGINTYFVSWAAHRVGLKVALSGLGGDEIFGGYATFASTPRAARLAAIGRRLPRALRLATAGAVRRAGAGGGDAGRKLAALWSDGDALPHPYFFTRALFTPAQVSGLRRGSGCALDGRAASAPWRNWMAESVRQAETLDGFAAVSCLEARSYMAQTLLRDTDSVSMAHSLEVRVPLIDHLLVEHVARLPARVKYRPGVSKALLAESLRDLLPTGVTAQRKRTFTLPWEHWMRGALGAKVRTGMFELAPSLAEHLDGEAVRALWSAFESGQTSWSRPWSLYVLNEWCRRHFDQQVPAMPVSAGAIGSAEGG
jgi:asparagine synthase (glutamine-hydrolysing)